MNFYLSTFTANSSISFGPDCFKLRYKTGNNIDAQETGFIKDIGEQYPNGVLVQHGEYQYEAPNGELVKVQYTADGNLISRLNVEHNI